MEPLTQEAVTLLYWIRMADRLRQKGVIVGGPKLRHTSEQLLLQAAARGIFPTIDDAAIGQIAELLLDAPHATDEFEKLCALLKNERDQEVRFA